MAQRDWKSIALLSIGFSVGVAYTVACDDQNPLDAHASESGSGNAGRAVVEVAYSPGEIPLSCEPSGTGPFYDISNQGFNIAELQSECCPVGFSFVGWGDGSTAVCLEDA